MGGGVALAYDGRMRSILPLLFALSSASLALSQEALPPQVLAVSETIDDCFALPGTATACVIQTGRTGAVLDLGRKDPVTRDVFSLPEGTFVWDLIPVGEGGIALFAVTARGLSWRSGSGAWKHVEGSGGFFRGQPTSAPLHRFFARARGSGFACALPTADGMRILEFGGDEPVASRSLDAPIEGRQFLGWGLGDMMEARRIVPGVRPFSANQWLIATPGRLFLVGESGRRIPWARMPLDRNTSLLGFEHVVEDRLVDLDQDGKLDLLFADPGHGRLLVYSGRGRPGEEPRGPDQILQKEGWIVGRFFLPGTAERPPALGILRVPRLSLVARVTVLEKGVLPAEVALHRWNGDRFDPTPAWSRRVALPFEIHLSSVRRRLRLRAPLSVHADRDGVVLILPDGEHGAAVFAAKGERVEKTARLELPPGTSLRFPEPLSGVWTRHQGGLRFSCSVENPEDGVCRVLAWDLP